MERDPRTRTAAVLYKRRLRFRVAWCCRRAWCWRAKWEYGGRGGEEWVDMGALNISLMGRHDALDERESHDCSVVGLCEAKPRVRVAQE